MGIAPATIGFADANGVRSDRWLEIGQLPDRF